MRKGTFVKKLKTLICEFTRSADCSLADTTYLYGYELCDKKKEILRELAELILNTSFFREETKEFLRGKSIEEITMEQNHECMKPVSVSTVKSRIFYQTYQLQKEIGEDALEMLVQTKSEEVMELYGKKIHQLLLKTREGYFLKNIIFKSQKMSSEAVTHLDEDTLDMLNELVVHYSKEGIKIIEKAFTVEMAGYIQYMEQAGINHTLKEEELEEYNLLKRYLG